MSTLPLKWMPAAAHGGPFKAPAATCVVIHSTESENTPGMAEALMGPGWFGGPKAGTSTHKTVDVDSICEGVKRTTVAYHAGPGGNTWGIAYEFCGRASWSAAKWREPAQLQMLRNAAPHIADDLAAIAGGRAEALEAARWLSLVQLARHEHGLCTHNDIRLALGGTTHSDPGPNFPYAELLAYVRAELGDTPSPRTGAAVTILGDDMPTVMQSASKPPILVVGGLFVELHSDEERKNALNAYNKGVTDVDADGVPQPVWVEDATLADLIAQSQRAVRGGTAA